MKINYEIMTDNLTRDGRQITVHILTDNSIVNGALNINRSKPYILIKTFRPSASNQEIKDVIKEELISTFNQIVRRQNAQNLQGQKFEVITREP